MQMKALGWSWGSRESMAEDRMCRACVETTLGTRLLIIAPLHTTIADLRGRIEAAHVQNFPENGEVVIKSIMIMVAGFWYAVTEGSLGVVAQGTDALFKVDLELFPEDVEGDEAEPKRQRRDHVGSHGILPQRLAALEQDILAALRICEEWISSHVHDGGAPGLAAVEGTGDFDVAAGQVVEGAADLDLDQGADPVDEVKPVASVEIVPSTPLHAVARATEAAAAAFEVQTGTQIIGTQIIGTQMVQPQILEDFEPVPTQVLDNSAKEELKYPRLFAVRRLRR
ncbi:uncharacterized protein LOC9646766 [Selaginella moellendorffii]|uniref:uncharacterized protein LOC9646766 n=1 Tax=Selaginella moellendorffii TaxID=88036 RepID=UPI000D1CE35E|nr:uncharacterized protein LOC9646766 [Selaginella moellendorffii]|eukprot:XP_024519603.1 uncharacterized protein LOC9646766 [Selaginella moellendorffii]